MEPSHCRWHGKARSYAPTYGGAACVCHRQSPWVIGALSLSLIGQQKNTDDAIRFILCLYFYVLTLILFVSTFYFLIILVLFLIGDGLAASHGHHPVLDFMLDVYVDCRVIFFMVIEPQLFGFLRQPLRVF